MEGWRGALLVIGLLLVKDVNSLKNFSPDLGNGNDSTAFTQMEGLFDEGFQPFRQTGHSKCGFLSTFGEIFLVGRDVIQSFTIAYFGIKTSPKLAVSMEVFRKNVMTVAAASNHTCKLPADAYYLLWSILVCVFFLLVQSLFNRIRTFCSRHWNERVDLAAAQRALV